MRQQVVRRLPLPFVAASTMLLGLAVACVSYTQWLQQRTAEAVARGVAGVRAAQEFKAAVGEVRANLNLFLVTRDPKYLKEAGDRRGAADAGLDQLERLAT